MVGDTLGVELVGAIVGDSVGRSDPHCICTEYAVEVLSTHTVNPPPLTEPSLSHLNCVPSDTATLFGPVPPLYLALPT